VDGAPDPPDPASGAVIDFTVRGPDVPALRAWSLLGDTDWLNRVGDNGAVRSKEVSIAEDGIPTIQGALAGPVGLTLPYTEVWTSWAWGRYFRQVRDLDTPFLRRTDYHARLVPSGDRVTPEIRLQLTVHPALRGPIRWLQASALQRRWQAALDGLAQPPVPLRPLPPAARGPLQAWKAATDAGLAERLAAHLTTASPTTLQQMRAFSLADQWGLPRDQVLEAMLFGVEAGMLELFWSVRCSRCSGPTVGEAGLSDLPDHAECPSCRLSTQTDLGANVEALFAPHPAIMPRVRESFCTLYPAASPELRGVFTLAPGQALQQTLALPPGRWRLGPGGDEPDLFIDARPGAEAAPLRWQPGAEGQRAVAAGTVSLELSNGADARRRLYLARVGTEAPQVLASYVTNHPTFRARMGHQSLAPDLRLSVRAVSLLFTDLSGSTAMYEALGDAQAFAVVRDHFTVLRAAVADCGGTVIKTIGDAVMAAFPTPVAALRCALRMQADFTRWADTLDVGVVLRLKAGVHVGPALAAHSDVTGLDYFGGTVNLAARTESTARGGDTVWTQAVHADPEVQRLLRARALVPEPFERALKGIDGPAALYRVPVSALTGAVG